MRISFISPFIKLDQKILEVFDSLGDLTIFSWDMPDIEIVYSTGGEKNHISMVDLGGYERISPVYPFDINVIYTGGGQIFDRTLEYFERLKSKSRVFCVLCEYVSFYSLYRVLGGLQNIDEVMTIFIRELGIFGKKLIQIIKDNGSEKIAENMLTKIPLAGYLLKYSNGCLVVGDTLYDEFMQSTCNLSDGIAPGSVEGFFKFEDDIKLKLYKWFADGECDIGNNKDVRADFRFIADEMTGILMQREYREMMIDDIIRDIVRSTKEML